MYFISEHQLVVDVQIGRGVFDNNQSPAAYFAFCLRAKEVPDSVRDKLVAHVAVDLEMGNVLE